MLIEKILLAIGLVLALEGALYALFPQFLRAMLERIGQVSERDLRIGGVLAMAIGVGIVWLIG